MKTYYDILGLPPDCEPDEIKAAFRRLALQHHPDRNPAGEGQSPSFLEIREAYDVLSDEETRADYDRELVENHDMFEYVDDATGAGGETPASGPRHSGGMGFGRNVRSEGSPLMFLFGLLLPLGVGGLVLVVFETPGWALVSAAGTLAVLFGVSALIGRD